MSRARHARSPQRVARAPDKSHSRLHFARSTRTISAEGCAGTWTNRTLACISHTRHARSPQRVARAWDKSHSRLRFARSTRTISAEGSPKRAFRTRLPQKLTRQSLQNERFVRDFLQKSSGYTHRSTHITQPCQAVLTRHSPLPRLTTSRFPAPATNLSASTRLTRTKSCACHEMSPPSHLATSRFPAPATRIALPRLKTRTKSCACHEK